MTGAPACLLESGHTVDTAPGVPRPSLACVYYGRLDEADGVRFYRLHLRAGDRLHVRLLAPRPGPHLGLAATGPGLPAEGRLPSFAAGPPDLPVIALQGRADKAEYEVFTPGAYWYPVTIDVVVPASAFHYVTVFSEQPVGPYGIAVGHEEKYTVAQWLALPAGLTTIYAWDAGWGAALASGLVVLLASFALMLWRAAARSRPAGRPLVFHSGAQRAHRWVPRFCRVPEVRSKRRAATGCTPQARSGGRISSRSPSAQGFPRGICASVPVYRSYPWRCAAPGRR